jgi:hypothetical protein
MKCWRRITFKAALWAIGGAALFIDLLFVASICSARMGIYPQ